MTLAHTSTLNAAAPARVAAVSASSARPARLAAPSHLRHGNVPKSSFLSGAFASSALRSGISAAHQRPARVPANFQICAVATEAAEEEETFEYQAEVNRLMDLIVNSLYSNKEVFLRELVSNSSDALDKIRFKSVGDASALGDVTDLKIRISADSEANTITIEDTGIGMSKADILDSLGTIARSGTAKFMEMLKESQQDGDNNLIGKFGVGFYSAFLVADKVRVQTKSNDDDQQWVWESDSGSHQFKIRADTEPSIGRGTKITLFLKEDSTEIADPAKLAELISTYSEFINFPIELYQSKSVPEEVVDEEASKKAKEEWESKKAAVEAKEEEWTEPEPATVMKTEYKTEWDWAVQNSTKPIWVRPKSELATTEYNEFFKSTFKEFLDPLAYNHFNVEGTIEFKGILYCPGMAPFEQDQMMAKSRNLKLYVKRVFISDEFDEDLVPRYLTFIKGVVDSSDLPLNVSREILQESRVVRIMRKQIVSKSLAMVKEIAQREDKSDYASFWEAFGRNIKLGCIEDSENRDDLAKLLRFHTSASGDEMRSLAEYVEAMPEGQKQIYYIAADSKEAAAKAPFLEKISSKGYEVVFLTEPIDEVAMTNVATFAEKPMVDITKEDLDLGEEDEEEKAKNEKLQEEFKGLTDWMAGALGEKVEKVVVSTGLKSTPALLVTSKFGWSANMERIMKAQAMGDNRAMEYMKGRKTMEINPESPIIKDIKARSESSGEDVRAKEMAELLFDTALLQSGFDMEDPGTFAARIYGMMNNSVSDSQDSS